MASLFLASTLSGSARSTLACCTTLDALPTTSMPLSIASSPVSLLVAATPRSEVEKFLRLSATSIEHFPASDSFFCVLK